MMDPDEIHRMLLASLAEVRKRHDDGGDDWRAIQLRVWIKFGHAIEIDPELLMPLVKMFWEQANLVFTERRRRADGTVRKAKPLQEMLPMAFAAAAVTVLSEKHGGTIAGALKEVSQISKIEKAKLENFRDNINRALASPTAINRYNESLALVRDWPRDELTAFLSTMRGFVS